MKNTVDLHIHTVASDGLYTPTQIVSMARRRGLRTIAITDHDTVSGVAEALEAARGTSLEVIPGVELSTSSGDIEAHLLGYGIDYTSGALVDRLARFQSLRLQRAKEILRRLRDKGIELSWEQLLDLAGGECVGRPHIARALQDTHYVDSFREAFDRYLAEGKPAYVPRVKMTPSEAIDLVAEAGGVPVLAHPWDQRSLVPSLVDDGLIGLEVYYPQYTPSMTAQLKRLAARHQLICTGGSDFHGLSIAPQNHLGGVHVPAACVQALKRACAAGFTNKGMA
ncbi:MAG: PHP domain-containing protein [Chloroflexota bacterium]|nr:PHP domain-containing protein [Chloroflexota bacterium]